MTTPSRHPCRLVLSASIAVLLGSGSVAVPKANAQIVKANNTDNLNLGSSWVGGVAPGAADLALWDATVVGPNTTILGANLNWSGVSIANPGGAVTIGGTHRLTLSGG
ncbi:MAG TPA: hypothetical protein VFG14_09725, partial [Chthoniobacteraceae bacterium]|nr:hypothetical protein [Chthoniobacteraceae bacterium]